MIRKSLLLFCIKQFYSNTYTIIGTIKPANKNQEFVGRFFFGAF